MWPSELQSLEAAQLEASLAELARREAMLGATHETDMSDFAPEELSSLAAEVDGVLAGLHEWQQQREERCREYHQQLEREYEAQMQAQFVREMEAQAQFGGYQTGSSLGLGTGLLTEADSTHASGSDDDQPLGLTLVEGLLAIRPRESSENVCTVDAGATPGRPRKTAENDLMVTDCEVDNAMHWTQASDLQGGMEPCDTALAEVFAGAAGRFADPGGERVAALRRQVEELRDGPERVPADWGADAPDAPAPPSLGSTALLEDSDKQVECDDMEAELELLAQRLAQLKSQGARLGKEPPAMARIQGMLSELRSEPCVDQENRPNQQVAPKLEAKVAPKLEAKVAPKLELAPAKVAPPAAAPKVEPRGVPERERHLNATASSFDATAELDQLLADVNAAVG